MIVCWRLDRLGRRKPITFAGYALTALSRPMIGPSIPAHSSTSFAAALICSDCSQM
jgi:hypothetical protein